MRSKAGYKTKFEMEHNSAYPDLAGEVNIIGRLPENKPYVSFTFQEDGNDIAHGWLNDKELETFAVNILRALNSEHLVK